MCESVQPCGAAAGEAVVVWCEVDLMHGIAPDWRSLVARFLRQEIVLV